MRVAHAEQSACSDGWRGGGLGGGAFWQPYRHIIQSAQRLFIAVPGAFRWISPEHDAHNALLINYTRIPGLGSGTHALASVRAGPLLCPARAHTLTHP